MADTTELAETPWLSRLTQYASPGIGRAIQQQGVKILDVDGSGASPQRWCRDQVKVWLTAAPWRSVAVTVNELVPALRQWAGRSPRRWKDRSWPRLASARVMS